MRVSAGEARVLVLIKAADYVVPVEPPQPQPVKAATYLRSDIARAPVTKAVDGEA